MSSEHDPCSAPQGPQDAHKGLDYGVEVKCAFCGGVGLDPFELLSPQSRCQVCGGVGRKWLHAPLAVCAFCHGTGVYLHSRLTCTSCGGVGRVESSPEAICCPYCRGSGRANSDPEYPRPESQLPCAHCGGKGFVGATGPRWRPRRRRTHKER